jgi:hypothetical protein
MGISETNGAEPCQARKNIPTSGLLRFLVARGGIDPGLKMSDPTSAYIQHGKLHMLVLFC